MRIVKRILKGFKSELSRNILSALVGVIFGVFASNFNDYLNSKKDERNSLCAFRHYLKANEENFSSWITYYDEKREKADSISLCISESRLRIGHYDIEGLLLQFSEMDQFRIESEPVRVLIGSKGWNSLEYQDLKSNLVSRNLECELLIDLIEDMKDLSVSQVVPKHLDYEWISRCSDSHEKSLHELRVVMELYSFKLQMVTSRLKRARSFNDDALKEMETLSCK